MKKDQGNTNLESKQRVQCPHSGPEGDEARALIEEAVEVAQLDTETNGGEDTTRRGHSSNAYAG